MKKGTRTKYFWIIIFLAGIIAGTLFANLFIGKQGLMDSRIGVYMDSIGHANEDTFNLFLKLLIRRFVLAAGLAGVVWMFKTPLFFGLLTFFYGLSFGYILAALTVVYGTLGCVAAIVLMLPQYLFFVPVFCIFLKLSLIKTRHGYEKIFSQSGGHKILGIVTSAVIVLIILGCVAESYVNPLFIKIFLKNI